MIIGSIIVMIMPWIDWFEIQQIKISSTLDLSNTRNMYYLSKMGNAEFFFVWFLCHQMHLVSLLITFRWDPKEREWSTPVTCLKVLPGLTSF